MSHWDEVREFAKMKRLEYLALSHNKSAHALLEITSQHTGISIEPLPANDSLLQGGQAMLDRENEIIWYNLELNPEIALLYQAHEFGHFWLHEGRDTSGSIDIEMDDADDPLPFGSYKVEGYSPEERQEREANIFAREFLLPTDEARELFFVKGWTATAITNFVGLPEAVVFHQITRSLVPDSPISASKDKPDHSPDTHLELDPEQTDATEIPTGPLLLEAGPGTGKTRSLTGRILSLLKRGVNPASILALTFSNQAAEEMRSRIVAIVPTAAPLIWIGTFHAFGLELLRKYGYLLGLPPRPKVLDAIETVFLLERMLPALELDYYQNLHEPTINLGPMLGAISRAKDELIGPAEYTSLAAEMRAKATSDDAIEAAEKVQEVARVYTLYQAQLEKEHSLDFGDLINRAVQLLRDHESVRSQLRQTYREILVDEYQDVNRASGLFLRELASDGRGLWVVGDVRQSIYRFRGAAPRNMHLFSEDFPGAKTLYLKRNYRSQPPIVELFSTFAPQMKAMPTSSFEPWQSQRQLTNGRIRMEIAEDRDAEIRGLARVIREVHSEGIPYREQAVLCRTHGELAQVAKVLTEAGIPTLSFGAFFEREEIRDLLSLLSLACHGDRNGLVRVSHFPEYQIPFVDVQLLLTFAGGEGIPLLKALRYVSTINEISAKGKQGFALLDQHLFDICYGTNPWQFLMQYLFNRSNYIRMVGASSEYQNQQQRLAIFQFLQFVYQQRNAPDDAQIDPKRIFLKYVRRIKQIGGDKELRRLPESTARIDAVRLLTVHASKGLEFSAVFLPFLGSGKFPAKPKYQPCPPPTGMLPEEASHQHLEEEECLFFVALSRARDFLCLSRARRYGKQNSNPSNFLAVIKSHLPSAPDGKVTWHGNSTVITTKEEIFTNKSYPTYEVEHLNVYLECPREFYYEFVLGLGGRKDDSAYVQFHHCVYAVLRRIRETRTNGQSPDNETAQNYFDEVWKTRGPLDHPYEALYRDQALAMLNRAVGAYSLDSELVELQEWVIPLSQGSVLLRPDEIETKKTESQSLVKVRRMRTGRATKGEKSKKIYALYQRGAELKYPQAERHVEISYLSSGHIEPVEVSPKNLTGYLKDYDDAIGDILSQSFTPNPSDHRCPRCPHYFICPSPTGV